MTDLDDTTRCPLGARCEACGVEAPDLAVSTASTPLGVLCLTLCRRCTTAEWACSIAVVTAAKLVVQHAGHLGTVHIDVDEMERLIGRGR